MEGLMSDRTGGHLLVNLFPGKSLVIDVLLRGGGGGV